MPKPEKPYPDFPLFGCDNGQWAKKIGGKRRQFGTDWKAALRKYHALLESPNSLKTCVAKYVESKTLLLSSDEISPRHLRDIKWTLESLSKTIGPDKGIRSLTSADYGAWRAHIAKTNGPVSVGNHIRRVKSFLNWAKREKLIADLPELKKPSLRVLRLEREERGSKMFEPAEIQLLLKHSGPQMRAMILLGLNCGLGNTDIAELRPPNLQDAWLIFPRHKTGIKRRAPLWVETCKALAAITSASDSASEYVFTTKLGNPWTPKGNGCPISSRFAKLCKDLDIYKKGRGFNSFRHCCQTIGEESGDYAATDVILGHIPKSNDMAAIYRERMSDERLKNVTEHIHQWAFAKVEANVKVKANAKVEAKVKVEVSPQGVA
jgi:integrase